MQKCVGWGKKGIGEILAEGGGEKKKNVCTSLTTGKNRAE